MTVNDLVLMNVRIITPALPEDWSSQNEVYWVKCPIYLLMFYDISLCVAGQCCPNRKKLTVKFSFIYVHIISCLPASPDLAPAMFGACLCCSLMLKDSWTPKPFHHDISCSVSFSEKLNMKPLWACGVSVKMVNILWTRSRTWLVHHCYNSKEIMSPSLVLHIEFHSKITSHIVSRKV